MFHDGCQKSGDNFLNLLQKKQGTEKGVGEGGFPLKRGVPTLEETVVLAVVSVLLDSTIFGVTATNIFTVLNIFYKNSLR